MLPLHKSQCNTELTHSLWTSQPREGRNPFFITLQAQCLQAIQM